MIKAIVRFWKRFKLKYITTSKRTSNFSETRAITTPPIRDINPVSEKPLKASARISKSFPIGVTPETSVPNIGIEAPEINNCPYCSSKDIVKRGKRQKKYEEAQLYRCNQCQRTFTGQKVKGKSFPLRVIFEGLSLYNIGYSLEESCRFLKEKFGLEVKPSTLSDWNKEFENLCRYSRLRSYGLKLFSPQQVIQTVHLYHRQVYDFSIHRAKLALLLQEYKHGRFENLREFLEAIQSECPHQFFQEGERISELKVDFDLGKVIIKEKNNFACRLADLVLQAVADTKLRHQSLQRFMLANDSVTVGVEVPVYMDDMDIFHMKEELGFEIPVKIEKVLTGHIDILQIRNGAIHILDYKPHAQDLKSRSAITQLTLYALALSRLTGLRLYEFKCAWFDEKAYFEFFPLHIVYKLKERMKKEDPNQLTFKEIMKPMERN